MRSLSVLIVVLGLVLAACSAGDAEPSTTSVAAGGETTTNAVDTTAATEGNAETPTSTSADVTTTLSDRPVAPDFTLDLGNGGSYTLSDDARPVYLVFWAEW